jgi:hypothetical protein
MSCQLRELRKMGNELNWIDDLLQARVRILRSLKRQIIYVKRYLDRNVLSSDPSASISIGAKPIKTGDRVKILTKSEIRKILDTHDKYKGCRFIEDMYEFCGREYTVLKQIDYFYDEVKQKLCRCQDTVILDSVVCSGKQRLYRNACDRHCFFFWHTAWLQKLADGEP